MSRPVTLLTVVTVGALAPFVTTRLAPRSGEAAGGASQPADRYCYTQWDDPSFIQNGSYDGRFTFFRVMYEPLGYGGRGGRGRRDKMWDHDTPRAEQHFMKILTEITDVRPQMECGAIYKFGDPESFKYPIAYVSEPGYWTMDEQELQGVRDFVAKGGFLIFDDFFAEAWYNFEEMWRRAFPELQIVKLEATHPVFDSFYRIESLDMFYDGPGNYRGARAEFYGAFEDNDPKKRLLMVANYNNDLGDYMEWSDESFLPIALSNEAYKLMVNYVIYAMTH
jgi:hypothetical protein